LDGGGATIADEIGGADGADSSACQSNGMAAAVRRKENRRSLKQFHKQLRGYACSDVSSSF